MKKFLDEFKAFALKGSMIDLAIGMIIGGAFTTIVNSLVNDIFMPILSLLTGRIDFSNLFIALDGEKYITVAQAEAAGAPLIKIGSFITEIINFTLMALVVFVVVKQINKLRSLADEKLNGPKQEEAPTTKVCPFCKSEIAIDATRCPHCTSELPKE